MALVLVFILSMLIAEWRHMETAVSFLGILLIIFSFSVFLDLFRAMTFLADESNLGPIKDRTDEIILF